MSDPHQNHRTAFALALRPIAPALAAFHAAHVRQCTASPTTCARCGHAPVHTRKKRRVIERNCCACAFVERVPVEGGAASEFKRTRKRKRAKVDSGDAAMDAPTLATAPAPKPAPASTPAPTPAKFPPVPASASGPPTPNTPTPSTPSPSASPAPTPAPKRSKKKSGLQELLARNRERQAQQQRAPTGGGLSSFLDGL